MEMLVPVLIIEVLVVIIMNQLSDIKVILKDIRTLLKEKENKNG